MYFYTLSTNMLYLRFIIFLLFFSLFSTNVHSQKIVAFDKRGKVKRVRYYEGQRIKLKLNKGRLVDGPITGIKTKSFLVGAEEIFLDSVSKVFNTQKLSGLKLVGGVFITAGAVYFPLDTFNRLINDDSPVANEKSAMVSGAFLGGGALLLLISNKGYKISSKRPLKIIDLTI